MRYNSSGLDGSFVYKPGVQELTDSFELAGFTAQCIKGNLSKLIIRFDGIGIGFTDALF